MKKRKLVEEEIDELVTKEAEEPSRWEKPILVELAGVTAIRLSPEAIRKARYFASLHRYKGYQTWLKHIIEERIRMEEEILVALRQDLRKGDSG